jgi:SAM-dependent methyltransferase
VARRSEFMARPTLIRESVRTPSSEYEDLAGEYYDPILHPTCANFREASGALLSEWLPDPTHGFRWHCDVGCGKSLLAEAFIADCRSLDHLLLVDSSRSMLAHSTEWVAHGARLILADADNLPIEPLSVDVLVSSLGDPYNNRQFWLEVSRVLHPRGVGLFTTPSSEWALGFRSGPDDWPMWAEFELSDGRSVRVPSLIHPIDQQVRLIKSCGLLVKEVVDIPVSKLEVSAVSPKLETPRGTNASIVTGYFLAKP